MRFAVWVSVSLEIDAKDEDDAEEKVADMIGESIEDVQEIKVTSIEEIEEEE